MDVIEEYGKVGEVRRRGESQGGKSKMGGGITQKSTCWYFDKKNYILEENAHKVRKDP